MFDVLLPERKCRKCSRTQQQLIDLLCDLLQDETAELDNALYICEECMRKQMEGKKNSDFKKIPEIPKQFKTHLEIKYQKEKKERAVFISKKFIPQILIEILMHFKFKNPGLYTTVHNRALNYQQKKQKQQNFMKGQDNTRQVYPKYTGRQINGDGKLASGYREDWQKGITQIIEAFNKPNFNFA